MRRRDLLLCAASFVFGVALTLVGIWLGGFNFDQRGFDAVAAYLLSIINGCGMASLAMVANASRRQD